MRTQPSGALGGAAPAQVLHGGRMPRSFLLPHLTEDIDISKVRAHRTWLAEEAAAKAHTRAKESPLFKPVDRLRVQGRGGPMLWNRVGEVEVKKDQGNSYFVRTEDGENLLLRNRRHLRPMEPETFKLVEEMSPHYMQEKKVQFSEETEVVDTAVNTLDSEEEEEGFVTAPSSPATPERDAPFRNTRSHCRRTRDEFMQAQDEFMQAQAQAKMEVAGKMMRGYEMLMKSRRV